MKDILSTSLLQAFVSVANHRSVTAAASELGRSQPAISQRLRQLEDELGVRLLQPQGRGVMLTRDGELLYEEAKEVIAKLRALPGLIDSESEEPRGILRIGSLPTITRHLLVDAIHQMVTEHPEVQLKIELGLETDLMAKLREGWLDAVYFIGDVDPWGLKVTQLADISIRVAARPGMFRAEPSLKDLSSQRLLLWKGPPDPSFQAVERHARSSGLVTPTTVEISHIDSLKALAAHGTGYTLLPDYVLTAEAVRNELITYPFAGFEFTFPLVLLTRKDRQTTRASASFACMVESTLSTI